MPSETELAWLAGFLDADGMIRLKIGMKNERGPKSFIPMVTYTNTCLLSVTRIAELVGQIAGFKASFDSSRDSQGRRKEDGTGAWKAHTVIEIYGLKRCVPFIKAVRPWLVTKGLEADLLLRFAEIRYQNAQRPYGSEEYRIFHALKYLKTTRHLRDYTPSIEQVLNEGIVRTNAEALEAAEMTARLSLEERREWTRTLVAKYRWGKRVRPDTVPQGSLFETQVTKATERH